MDSWTKRNLVGLSAGAVAMILAWKLIKVRPPPVAIRKKTWDLKFGLWNMLSDGLSIGEFMTYGGDAQCCRWEARKHKVVAVLHEMLQQFDVVGVIENDHFHWILSELQKKEGRSAFGGVHMLDVKRGELKTTPTYKFSGGRNSTATFASECGPFASELAALYGVDPQSKYRVDDGLSLYYRTDRITPVSATSGQVGVTESYAIQRLRDTRHDQDFTVSVGHLASGDSKKDELKRVATLERMLAEPAMAEDAPMVMIMDSNYSSLYQQEAPRSADHLLRDAGWVNLVAEEGTECFKMRHAQGGQPKKFGALMFDGIDKILVKKSVRGEGLPLNLATFTRSLSAPGQREQMLALRKDPVRRGALKQACTEHAWGDDCSKIQSEHVQGVVDLELLHQLYPNQQAPSDHPPVGAVVSFPHNRDDPSR